VEDIRAGPFAGNADADSDDGIDQAQYRLVPGLVRAQRRGDHDNRRRDAGGDAIVPAADQDHGDRSSGLSTNETRARVMMA